MTKTLTSNRHFKSKHTYMQIFIKRMRIAVYQRTVAYTTMRYQSDYFQLWIFNGTRKFIPLQFFGFLFNAFFLVFLTKKPGLVFCSVFCKILIFFFCFAFLASLMLFESFVAVSPCVIFDGLSGLFPVRFCSWPTL